MKNEYSPIFAKLFSLAVFPDDAFYIEKVFADKTIIVYGAGESFHYFKEVVMRRYAIIPSVVLDRKFKSGDTFEGIAAISPVDYMPSAQEKEAGLVVICLGNQTYFNDIVVLLKEMGFRNIISLMDIYEIHNPFSLPVELKEQGFQYYQSQRENIESSLGLFEDKVSCEVYLRCIETHLNRKPVPIPMCERGEQYIPKGIKLSRGYSKFIYCGASVGDIAHIFGKIAKIKELICFEPDPNQYKLIAEYLLQHQEQIAEKVIAIPCAVYSDTGIEPFTYSDTSFGSRILPTGSSYIQTVTLDSVLPGFKPTFINMDIEGSEFEALKGAEKTIRMSKPDLAICLYHAPNHLWEIPLYLHNLGLGYKFYLRNYTGLVGETVLYASI